MMETVHHNRVSIKSEAAYQYSSLIVIILILLPTSEYSIRFLAELLIISVFLFFRGAKVPFAVVLLSFVLLIIFSAQSILALSIFEFLELGRFLSFLTFIYFIRDIKLNQILTCINIVATTNLIALFFNYFIDPSFLKDLYFNNLTVLEAYGRNSGIFSGLNVSGLFGFSLIYVSLCLRRFSSSMRIVFLILGVISLIGSGSKTFIGLTGFLMAFFTIRVFIRFLLLRMSIFGILYLTGISSLSIFIISFLGQIQVLDQLDSLYNAIIKLRASSITSRLKIWNFYFSFQAQELEFILLGVPKSYLAEFNSTFDSDYVWLLVRLGWLVGGAIIIIPVVINGFILLRKRNYLIVSYAFFVMIAAATLGVMTDPQSALICILFYKLLEQYRINNVG